MSSASTCPSRSELEKLLENLAARYRLKMLPRHVGAYVRALSGFERDVLVSGMRDAARAFPDRMPMAGQIAACCNQVLRGRKNVSQADAMLEAARASRRPAPRGAVLKAREDLESFEELEAWWEQESRELELTGVLPDELAKRRFAEMRRLWSKVHEKAEGDERQEDDVARPGRGQGAERSASPQPRPGDFEV